MVSPTSFATVPSAPMTDVTPGVDETEGAVESLRKAFGEWTLAPTEPNRTRKVCAIIERVGSQVRPKNCGRLEEERSLKEVCTAICQEAIDRVKGKFSKPESRSGEYDKLRASIRAVEKALFQDQSPLAMLDAFLIERILSSSDDFGHDKPTLCRAYELALRGWRDQFDPHKADSELQKVPDALMNHAGQIIERVNKQFGLPARQVSTSEEAIAFLNEMVTMADTINEGLPKALCLAFPSKDIVKDVGLLEDLFQKAHDFSFVEIFRELAGVLPDASFEDKLRDTKKWFSTADLTKITSLVIQNRGLVFIPSEIGNLKALKLLDLSANRLTFLPPEIGNLRALEELRLTINRLDSIPSEIGNLSDLEVLILSYNCLSSVPSAIGNLGALTSLDLLSNHLASIPSAIVNLGALTSLNLRSNQISSVPPEIGDLGALQWLGLCFNQITSVPSEIGKLSALTFLDLSSNQIASVPSEIEELGKLCFLHLNNNQLHSVPPEIGNLGALKILNLRNNPLTFLPPEVRNLKSLCL